MSEFVTVYDKTTGEVLFKRLVEDSFKFATTLKPGTAIYHGDVDAAHALIINGLPMPKQT